MLNCSFSSKAIVFIVLIFFTYTSSAQVSLKFSSPSVQCTAEVRVIDSSYILFPQLIVNDKDRIISIREQLSYSQGHYNASAYPVNLYLQKKINHTWVDLTLWGATYFSFTEKELSYRDYRYGDCLNEKIDVSDYFPLERGEYRISVTIDYIFKGKYDYMATSNWAYFTVTYLPFQFRW